MKIAIVLVFCLSAGATQPRAFTTGIEFLLAEVEEMWKIVGDNADSPGYVQSEDRHKKLFDKTLELAMNIEAVEKTSNVEFSGKSLQTLAKQLRMENKIIEPTRRINDEYQRLEIYARSEKSRERLTLLDFAKSAVTHGADSVKSLLGKLHYIAIGDAHYDNMLDVLTDTNLANSSSCMVQESPYQLLYNLYQSLILTEMKGYAIIQFSYMVLKLHGEGNYAKESKIERSNFVERCLATTEIIRESLSKASRHLWACDPEKQIEGVTYIEITQLLQGYLQNEVDLNNNGTCSANCATYQNTRRYSCYQNMYCNRQRYCNGEILNCQFVESDMVVCPSTNQMKRRYEYIEYSSGSTLGRKEGTCPNKQISVHSWWRWIFWHCSYCLCLCDDEGSNSDRYINMLPVISNTTKNMVVVGLKFSKSNRIVHLQIQEGKLLPGGNVDRDTISWVPVHNYTLDDKAAFGDEKYFTLAWNNRDIDLDVLDGRDGYVLTGVKFEKIGTHLNFQIRITPFVYETGILRSDLSEWVHNANTGLDRKQIVITDRDVPTRSNGRSEIRSSHNEFLEMTHTGYIEDAAQTTVPFFDAQGVSSSSAPNSGAGIYFKSPDEKSGGYIGLKLVTYDYANQLLRHNDFADSTPRGF